MRTLAFMAGILFGAGQMFAQSVDITVDNSSAVQSPSQVWTQINNITTAYGGDYLYLSSGTGSVTFTTTTLSASQAGNYQVYIWLPVKPSGANSSEQIQVNNGTASISVNYPSSKTGGWYYVGTYAFTSGTAASVTINKVAGNSKCVADAVRFLRVDGLPGAPNNIITRGNITTNEPSLIVSATSGAVNRTALWKKMAGGYLSDGNLNKGSCTAAFMPDLKVPGAYDVYTVWVPSSKNSRSVQVSVQPTSPPNFDNPPAVNLRIDETQNGGGWANAPKGGIKGTWQYLGRFRFEQSNNNHVIGQVTVLNSDPVSGIVTAGAVAYEKVGYSNLLVDDADNNSSITGTSGWIVNKNQTQSVGPDYIYKQLHLTGTVTFFPANNACSDYCPGWYGVYIRYGAAKTYSKSATVSILDGGNPFNIEPGPLDETQSASQWVCLGYYHFISSNPSVIVCAPGADGKSVSADAVNLVRDETQNSGMPDYWLLAYFGSLGVDPGGDCNGNGISNFVEFQTGGNPIILDTEGGGPSAVEPQSNPSDHTAPVINLTTPNIQPLTSTP